MQRLLPLLTLLLGVLPALAAPPDVCLPETVIPSPMPPTPTTAPLKVTADREFIVNAKGKVTFLTSPPGLISVTVEAQPDAKGNPPPPYVISGKFVNGPDKMVKKSFPGPFVYRVTPAKSGDGELFIVPTTVNDEKDITRRAVSVDDGTAPQPPPVPPVPPTPPTPVDPASPIPSPDGGLKVLIVYEKDTLASLPQSQVGVLTSADLRTYLNAKCGTSGYVITDKDVKYTTKVWADAMARDRKSVPWIVVGNGKTGYEGPLPATVADTLTLLKKYGGN